MTVLTIPTAEVYVPLLAPARYKGAHGGRGSAKSHFFAGLWLEENVADKYDCVMLRETLKSLEFSVKKLLESKIFEHNAGAYFEVQDRRILSKNGGVTIFEGMQNHTSDSIKSLEGFDRAWFEEAQTASQKSLDLLRPTIRKRDSEMWFSWNPRHQTDPIDAFLRSSVPYPDSIVVRSSWRDNPWLPDVLKQEIDYDLARDPEKYAHVWMGEYVRNSESRIFKNWVVREFDVHEGALIRQGADWGFAIDPSVLVQCYIIGRTIFVPHEAYMIGCEITSLPELFATVPESDKWWITADSARPETISYMQKHGYPKMGPAVKGAGSLNAGIEWMQSYDIVVHPRCSHTIDELTLYSYKLDPLTQNVLPLIEDKNNHVIDALRYACEGARRAKQPAHIPKPTPRFESRGSQGWLG